MSFTTASQMILVRNGVPLSTGRRDFGLCDSCHPLNCKTLALFLLRSLMEVIPCKVVEIAVLPYKTKPVFVLQRHDK